MTLALVELRDRRSEPSRSCGNDDLAGRVPRRGDGLGGVEAIAWQGGVGMGFPNRAGS